MPFDGDCNISKLCFMLIASNCLFEHLVCIVHNYVNKKCPCIWTSVKKKFTHTHTTLKHWTWFHRMESQQFDWPIDHVWSNGGGNNRRTILLLMIMMISNDVIRNVWLLHVSYCVCVCTYNIHTYGQLWIACISLLASSYKPTVVNWQLWLFCCNPLLNIFFFKCRLPNWDIL